MGCERFNIVIDAAHGGDDYGDVSYVQNEILLESRFNLKIALALEAIIKTHPTYSVIMTRKNDETIALTARSKKITDYDQLLICIHNIMTIEYEATKVYYSDNEISRRFAEKLFTNSELRNVVINLIDDKIITGGKFHSLVRPNIPFVMLVGNFLNERKDITRLDQIANNVAVNLFNTIEATICKPISSTVGIVEKKEIKKVGVFKQLFNKLLGGKL